MSSSFLHCLQLISLPFRFQAEMIMLSRETEPDTTGVPSVPLSYYCHYASVDKKPDQQTALFFCLHVIIQPLFHFNYCS